MTARRCRWTLASPPRACGERGCSGSGDPTSSHRGAPRAASTPDSAPSGASLSRAGAGHDVCSSLLLELLQVGTPDPPRPGMNLTGDRQDGVDGRVVGGEDTPQ